MPDQPDEGDDPQLVPVWVTLVEGPGAATLADLNSAKDDVAFAHECLERLSAIDGEAEAFMFHALWTAGLISYRRAFTSGASLGGDGQPRMGLHRHVTGLEAAFDGIHGELYAEADKHIAHQASNREQAKVLAMLANPDHEERKVLGIAIFTVRLRGPADGVLERALQLTGHLLALVDEHVRLTQMQLLDEARATPVDHWYRNARPSDDTVRQPRST